MHIVIYMKHYSKLLFLVFVVFYWGGCTSTKKYYFHSALESTNLSKSDEDGFVWESDSLNISYFFTGLDLTMQAIVKNKTNMPIIIDWSKSSIRINDFQEKSISDMPGSLFSKKKQSIIAPLSVDSFLLLRAGRFDMKTINKRNMAKEQTVFLDQKTLIKSIKFNTETSPLVLSTQLFLNYADADTILETSFFIDKISNIDKKMFGLAKTNSFAETKGFYSSYTKMKGVKIGKITNAIFDQLITTTVYSLLCGKLVVSPEDCDDDDSLYRY